MLHFQSATKADQYVQTLIQDTDANFNCLSTFQSCLDDTDTCNVAVWYACKATELKNYGQTIQFLLTCKMD